MRPGIKAFISAIKNGCRLLRGISFKIIALGTHLLVSFLPERTWYSVLWRLTRLLAFFIRPIIGWTPYRSDPRREILAGWILQTFLRLLPESQKPFPIPIRIDGAEALIEASTNAKGLVILSVHLPLTGLIVTALEELNHPPTFIVSQGLRKGVFTILGKGKELPLLISDGGVLLRARTILNHGGSLGVLINTGVGSPLNGNFLRLIGRAKARAIFAIAALQTNGEILVQWYTPPNPFCRSEEEVAVNLEFFQAKLDDLLHPAQDVLNPTHSAAARKDPCTTSDPLRQK
jgi:hypothetical protein